MTTQIPNSMLVSPGGVSDATARAQATAAQTTADSKATLQIGTLAASTTSAPNATAVMAAIAAGTGGAATTLRTAATNAIPLDTAGNGRAMPLVAGQTILINAPTTLTIAAGAIEGASCEATYYVASTITLPTTYPGIPAGAAVIVNGTLTVGFRYRLVFGISAGDLVIFCFQQAAVDVVAPTLLSASVANATPAQIDLVFNKSMFATWSASSAFVVTGHLINSITRLTATTGFLTSSTAFVNGESARTLSYTQPGTNNMQDLAGNLLVNIVAAAVTNNTGASAPLFVSSTPSAATVGTPYSYTYAATNTTSYPLVSGTFPAGLTYTPATGNISGTPTAVSAVVHMVSAVGPGGTTNGPSNTLTVNAALTPRTDTFNRANQAGLGTPSDAGSAWFGNTAAFSIFSNQVLGPGAGVTGAVALLAGCPSNGTFMIDITNSWTTPNASFPGIVFRATDASNYLNFRIAGADATYVVEAIVAGVATTLASGASGINTAAVASLKVVTSGTSILCYYIQGGTTVLVSTVTSSQFQTATSAGIFDYQQAGSSVSLDNFSAA